MDKKQQRTFARDTTWQDARTQSKNAEFIDCLNTPFRLTEFTCLPIAVICLRKINSACPRSKKLTQFTSLWWGSKKLAQTVFSQLLFLTSHKTLLYHWATYKENNTKAQLMFCQSFIVEEFLLSSS